jgi:hypothetical protein
MSSLKPLSDFFKAIADDPRISITHIAIYMALLQYRDQKQGDEPLYILSYEIMRIAKISGCATYHKVIRQLSEYGYIRYEPSYKRNQKSKVYLLIQSNLSIE